ncbi:MAG: LacI family DNA-binding transcriptional regulator [Pseudorhodobacter sp.]|nr:LacI family DNA-binding transcriptional regulator [Pseudorhodobacter sp.]
MNEAKPNTGRVTIRTVAMDAGVSVAAVSKVLRNAYGVSEALRQNVLESIERLNYRPSNAARGMRGQTYTIGVLLVGIDNPFLPQVFAGIDQVAAAGGYKILLGVGAARMPMEARLIEQMIDNHMDGIVLIAAQLSGPMLEIYARQIPIAVIGHHEPSAVGYDTVNSDDVLGARLAVGALLDKGHRDIGMVSLGAARARDLYDVAPQREIGYAAAMAEAGLAPQIYRFDNLDDERMGKLAAFLASPQRPRALFVWSDLDGILILNIACQMGLRVPEDLALIAYDDSPVAALPLINLASIDQSGRQLGELAAKHLLSRIGGRVQAIHQRITPRLVPRGSL